jgi:sugar phosphate isomerase/epimerase
MSFRIALQLYTLREETKKDFWGTCARVAEMGYEWVELAGLPEENPETAEARFRSLGLGVAGSHVPYEKVLAEPERVLAHHLALRCGDVIIPSLPRSAISSAESCEKTAQRLNELAEKYAREGVRLGFHHHDGELRSPPPLSGNRGREPDELPTFWHWLMASAPALQAQVDTYWVAYAGRDVVKVLEFVRGRVPSVHMKDMREDGEDVEFGRGILDWSSIFNACVVSGVETLVVELDRPKMSPLESARVSLENLRAFLQMDFSGRSFLL